MVANPAFGIGAKQHNVTGKISLYAEHDIALMELQRPARIDKRVSPVCIDSGLEDFHEGKITPKARLLLISTSIY